MAKHEGMSEKGHPEHARKMRKRGGEVDHAETPDEEAKEEEKESERAAGGGVQARKHGGKIDGKMPTHRPDKRARGGATADLHPETAAGHMSSMPFERVGPKPDGGGKGLDRD